MIPQEQNQYLRYHAVLDACSSGQIWQTMLSKGVFFAPEGNLCPCLFSQKYSVAYKISKVFISGNSGIYLQVIKGTLSVVAITA